MSLLNSPMGLFSHPAMQFYLSTTEQIKQHYAAAAMASSPPSNLSMFSIDNILAPRSHHPLFAHSGSQNPAVSSAAVGLYGGNGGPAEQAGQGAGLHGFHHHHQPPAAVAVGNHASSQMHSAEIMQGMPKSSVHVFQLFNKTKFFLVFLFYFFI